MKVQVRSGVFETNSSSMHSLVIRNDIDEYVTAAEVKAHFRHINLQDGTDNLRLRDLEFGRAPFKVLTSFYDKMCYALASMCEYKGDAAYNEICSVIRTYVPEFRDFELDFTTEFWRKHTWAEEQIRRHFGENNYKDCGEYWVTWGYELGYVDDDILTGFLKKENISIAEFLTNKKYFVVVDGDEYCIYSDMKDFGIINTKIIEREYPVRNEYGVEVENETTD